MSFVGEKRRALVGQLASERADVEGYRRPALLCLEGPPGWGKTSVVRELYRQVAGEQSYWPQSLGDDRNSVSPGGPPRDPNQRPPWVWSGVRVVGGLAQFVLGAHADQVTAQLDVILSTAERNRAARRAVGATAVFAAGHQYAHLGDLFAGTAALLSIAKAVGSQRDLSLSKGGRLATGAERGGIGGERLLARLRDAEREEMTVVLVFDDAHEAGENVCGFFEELLAGPMPVGCMCVCTARSDRLDSPFGRWLVRAEARFSDRVRRVSPARLSANDIASLVEEYAPGTSHDRVRAFVERAEGNPLVLEALISSAQRTGGAEHGAVTLAPEAIAQLPSFDEELGDAWRATEPDVREVLSVASAQGRAFVSALAIRGCTLAGLPERDRTFEATLRSAVERGLWVTDVGGSSIFRERYSFELARRGLEELLPNPEQLEELYVGLIHDIAGWKASPEWEDLSDQIKVILLRLHVALAEQCGRQPPSRVDEASVAASAEQLARGDLMLGEPLTALLDFEKAVERATMLPLTHPAALIARGNLAASTYLSGDLAESVELLRAVVDEHERVLGSEHPDTLTATANLGIALYKDFHFAEAVGLQRVVLARSEDVFGSGHPETIAARINLAATLDDSGKPAEAITLQRQVIADVKLLRGADDPDIWTARTALALSLQDHGELIEAIPLFRKILAYYERTEGKRGLLMLAARNNLASAYKSAGDLGAAIPLLEQTLADVERVIGPEHPHTLLSRNNLALGYQMAEDLEHAIPLLEQTLAESERVRGPDHPDTLSVRSNLAVAYGSAGDLEREILLDEQTLTDRERVLGGDHPDTLMSRSALAVDYSNSGDLERAIPLYEQALADTERVLDPDHPLTLTTRNALAVDYANAGDLERAIPLLEQTLADNERLRGPDHPASLTSRHNLANVYASAGDLGRAIPMLEQTLADSERLLGPDHPDTLTSRNNLATGYRLAGDLERAISLYQQTLEDRERLLGPEHPDTVTTRDYLDNAREAAGPRVTWRVVVPREDAGLRAAWHGGGSRASATLNGVAITYRRPVHEGGI